MRSIFLLVLIGTSLAVFFTVVKPRYDALKTTKIEIAAQTLNLETATKLKQSREDLISTYNSIPKKDIDNLKTLLPDSVDNIRLIIQLNSLATKNGLSILRNIDFDAKAGVSTPSTATPGTPPDTLGQQSFDGTREPYGEFILSFDTTGPYKNFLTFLSDLEQNLRLVDVVSIGFTPAADDGTQSASSNIVYKVKLKTYWLKQ